MYDTERKSRHSVYVCVCAAFNVDTHTHLHVDVDVDVSSCSINNEDGECYVSRKRSDQCYGNNVKMQAIAEM